jgi:2-keto-4-pentenoate hydratase/2-oxohepta-3-ene-1,7-dioic acid hydratase in catechol pathway
MIKTIPQGGPLHRGQITQSYGQATAWISPLGPALVTADEVDPARLELTTRLNGEVMQNAVTGDLIFTVAESLAFFSRWYEFTPGDILSTGTPAGVGFGRSPQVFIKPRDVVEVEVSGLGKISNRFVAG